ncbi:aminoglycoside N(3)-acetyltransferase [Myceligenerans pegani]|uniref:Aminoglycoside N(3)-acetyltransferase n=1 Tax=Myceligenerans pegani TaxID=2776917 RepID=A0ABR9N311_9MICO|nr:AAC(3) family N-acetyltransferase [Myceligenerans sp. TRM 65318]MBE1878045.1 AAC(3) family N-acetyltransferase [Myceligenerans sp. TRM 65318]MBE3020316.1 AAC(3) family N-acetyltransferase [Myceligenerans sp. TRM 65318]
MDQASPHTVASLAGELRALGVAPGDVFLVHSSMRSLGFVAGGVHAVVEALLSAVGAEGTVVVPTHTSEYTDPAGWQHPPVPESWWPVIRSETPGFDPARTPSRWVGVLPEVVRAWPGALRSAHPHVSCVALGARAPEITAEHDLGESHGERSPIGHVYRLGGKVLLLGCGHDASTSLHLAERRQPSPPMAETGAAIRDATGTSRWVTWTDLVIDEEDFPRIGTAFEDTGAVTVGTVGSATARLMDQRQLVDFAVDWMAHHRA